MLMLVPMVAPVLALPAWFHPDGALAVLLSVLPPTATMALSVRLALTEVPCWQTAVGMIGMILSIALLRRAAGKVFAMAILMHGKEPSWREMWAAARRKEP
jgi:ABC-2 type transport system permease protein